MEVSWHGNEIIYSLGAFYEGLLNLIHISTSYLAQKRADLWFAWETVLCVLAGTLLEYMTNPAHGSMLLRWYMAA